MPGKLILVLGGARSGKSRFALTLAQGIGPRVLFIATAAPGDEEMKHRIEEHRRHRPPTWKTVEALAGAGEALKREAGGYQAAVVDCLTLLLSNLMGEGEQEDPPLEQKMRAEVEALIEAASLLPVIVVSNEVGMGMVPMSPLARRYRDLLGLANQLLAQAADEVYFLIAGMPLKVKPGQAGSEHC